jgi:hypothetical protein
MTCIDAAATTIQLPDPDFALDAAHLAAAAFLARYSGRTLDAYRHDLRGYFNWTASVGLAVLDGTRPHIELYRGWLEERGLAASTIDRRLSTVCGFYRFAHIDGRVPANPAQYVRRPQVHPSDGRGLDRSELGRFLFAAERFDHDHAALAVLLRPEWTAGLRGLCHQRRRPRSRAGTSNLADPRQGQQARHHPVGASHGTDDRSRRRGTLRGPDPATPRRTAPRPAHGTPLGPLDRQAWRPRPGAPPHVASSLHHGRSRCRSPAS